MNNNCEKMKDQIADLVSGVLPETQLQPLLGHINECSDCRDYYSMLQKEDKLLTELFMNYHGDMATREEGAIKALEHLPPFSRINILSRSKMINRSPYTRFAATAAVIVFVTAYFVITLTWLLQIKECIRYCS